MNLKSNFFALFLLTSLSVPVLAASSTTAPEIDKRSFNLGGIHSWVEVVSLGIKKMALSSAMSAELMDSLEQEAKAIAKKAEVEMYREPEFLVTDLFPLAATKNIEVLIIYQGKTLDEYLALKKRKADLIKSGAYDGKARREIAWAMGKLLSYPDAKIEGLIARNTDKEE